MASKALSHAEPLQRLSDDCFEAGPAAPPMSVASVGSVAGPGAPGVLGLLFKVQAVDLLMIALAIAHCSPASLLA